MHLYSSGTPRNDIYQTVENRLCTHRLFSLHGSYEAACLRWLEDVSRGIFTEEDYLKCYPEQRDAAIRQDARRRFKQSILKDTVDWDTLELLSSVCRKTKGAPYPKKIMLDSGAFTAWNKGDSVSVDEVLRKYSRFLEGSGDLFDEIWMINLDKIPGERGRDPTLAELDEAVKVSDENFKLLTHHFGSRILPVFHQGESSSRLDEVLNQAEYICVSPRNDVAEKLRVEWSAKCHLMISQRSPNTRTHGLATTGNNMIRTVPWYSGDSAAWVQHGGFGMVDIFHEKGTVSRRGHPHYANYFVAVDQMTRDDEYGELVYGKASDSKFLDNCSPAIKKHITNRIERLGFPLHVARWDSRVRNLVCMAEICTYAREVNASEQEVGPATLFGGLDALN